MELQTILRRLSITGLTPMQEDTIDAFLHSDKDLMILSPTGSGKTLAYLLPLTQTVNIESDEVQVIVVVPGRELALQSSEVCRSMSSGLRSMACYGGRPAMDEHKVLKQMKPHIVFGTPGRLNDHLEKGNINAGHVRLLVLDEFDKCMQMGFMAEMTDLVSRLHNVERRILLSATEPETLEFVNSRHLKRINYVTEDEQVPDRVSLFTVKSPDKDKLETLRKLLLTFGNQSTIVFLNHRDAVERTETFLNESGFATTLFHGGLDQQMRETALYKFSNAATNILVSTDLASRGLDIPDVDNIVHYHLPETQDAYIHRVGRTARWEQEGRAFFLLNSLERVPDYVEAECEEYVLSEHPVQTIFTPRRAILYIGKGKKDKLSKGDIVGFLCKKGGLQSSEIGRIDVKERYTYAAVPTEKLKTVLRNVAGEKIKGMRTIIETIK